MISGWECKISSNFYFIFAKLQRYFERIDYKIVGKMIFIAFWALGDNKYRVFFLLRYRSVP